MRSSLTLFLILLLAVTAQAQFKVEGTISGYLNRNLILLEYFGDEHRILDSTDTDGNGWFSFEMERDAPIGMYSIAAGKSPLFNLIFNRENIILKYNPGELGPPEFIQSAENLIYFDFLVQSDLYDQKSSMLMEILQYYPERDSFHVYTAGHFQNLQTEFRAYTEMILNDFPTTLVSHIVKSSRPVMYPDNMDWEKYISFNQRHFFDETDFNDTILIRTNVFTAKAIDYLGFYSINNQSKALQEEFFAQAVDTILHKAMVNGKVYNFLMQYLIEGFEMYGFERVISHIAAIYEPANACVNEERKSELEKRMENLRKLAVGNIAPDIAIKDPQGNTFDLASIDSDLTVVLFWASWCPHCNQMMPGLKEAYEDNSLPDFEILAISIDTSATDYSQALALHASPWINYSEFKGWDSQAAIDFSIYATPTMFLLDGNRKILARPVTVRDLRYELQTLK
ncbi:MAG: hypothetical protein DRJ15_03825 [Bacteroidetes bacterium]|nr:MAG: hypothetical protein DRJ15_03825 [Bacteroidota bacterium]